MYITNNPAIAKIAEGSGVDRIFVDMEFIGKELRQANMDTVKSHHTFDDVENIKNAISSAELLVRCNPIHDKSDEYCSTEEEIDELAQDVLDDILTDDMTQVDKMWAIYKYVNSSMTYDGTSNKNDWRVEAKRGFTSGYGDCFTYYSMSDILLEKIGVEKMKVNRVGGQSKHYWHMVNVDGNWYHFDPCYRRNSEGRWNAFLRTDAEVAAFAAKVGIPNYEYYTYDKTKYPAVSTVEFEWDRDSYREK